MYINMVTLIIVYTLLCVFKMDFLGFYYIYTHARISRDQIIISLIVHLLMSNIVKIIFIRIFLEEIQIVRYLLL
jgi:hypothetical protein